MTELIVALDTDDAMTLVPALHGSGVTFFKFNATSLMNPEIFNLLHLSKLDFFMDLKVYDTRGTRCTPSPSARSTSARAS